VWEVLARCQYGNQQLTGKAQSTRKQEARRLAAGHIWTEYCKLTRSSGSSSDKEVKTSSKTALQKLQQLAEQHSNQINLKKFSVTVQCTVSYRGEDLTTVATADNEAAATERASDDMLRVLTKLASTITTSTGLSSAGLSSTVSSSGR
jgi:hypothetical protein